MRDSPSSLMVIAFTLIGLGVLTMTWPLMISRFVKVVKSWSSRMTADIVDARGDRRDGKETFECHQS